MNNDVNNIDNMDNMDNTDNTTIKQPRPLPSHKRPDPLPRINVIEQVYWQGPDAQPILSEVRVAETPVSKEEPYRRNKIRITHQWSPADLGWFKDQLSSIGTIVIVNQGSVGNSIIEVGISLPSSPESEGVAEIPVGHSHRIRPLKPESIRIRSRIEEGLYSIWIFPK